MDAPAKIKPRRTPVQEMMFIYGLRAGLPFPAIRVAAEALDVARRPLDCWRRRRVARSVSAGSPRGNHIPRAKGFAPIDSSIVPEVAALVSAGQALYAERASSVPQDGAQPFYDILTSRDILDRPAFLDAALSPAMVGIAAGYFGTMPRLQNIMLCVSPGRAASIQSELYHLDKPSVGFLQAFLNVLDVGPESGPLTFLPADVTSRVRGATSYERRSYSGDTRLSDEEVFQHCRPEDAVALVGPAGRGAFVDTSNCLHFGSRCRGGVRVVCIIQYAPAHKCRPSFSGRFDGHRFGGDPIRSLLLDGARPRSE